LRSLGAIVDYVRVEPPGLWEWELRDLTDGVLDFVWDVAAAGTALNSSRRSRSSLRALPDLR